VGRCDPAAIRPRSRSPERRPRSARSRSSRRRRRGRRSRTGRRPRPRGSNGRRPSSPDRLEGLAPAVGEGHFAQGPARRARTSERITQEDERGRLDVRRTPLLARGSCSLAACRAGCAALSPISGPNIMAGGRGGRGQRHVGAAQLLEGPARIPHARVHLGHSRGEADKRLLGDGGQQRLLAGEPGLGAGDRPKFPERERTLHAWMSPREFPFSSPQ
jgi:hypothetical protein